MRWAALNRGTCMGQITVRCRDRWRLQLSNPHEWAVKRTIQASHTPRTFSTRHPTQPSTHINIHYSLNLPSIQPISHHLRHPHMASVNTSAPSSVESSPCQTPRLNLTVCAGCRAHVGAEYWRRLHCCQAHLCMDCFKRLGHIDSSVHGFLHGTLDCPTCGVRHNNIKSYELPCTALHVQTMAEYDSRDQTKDNRGLSPELQLVLKHAETDKLFGQQLVTGVARSTDTVVITLTRPGQRFDKWLVTMAHGDNLPLVSRGRTLHEAMWHFRRQLKSAHKCDKCGTCYQAKVEGCVDCLIRASLNPQRECVVCKEVCTSIYATICKHVVCKECITRMSELPGGKHYVPCPMCRRPVHINKGFVERNCGAHHHHGHEDTSEDDSDYE